MVFRTLHRHLVINDNERIRNHTIDQPVPDEIRDPEQAGIILMIDETTNRQHDADKKRKENSTPRRFKVVRE